MKFVLATLLFAIVASLASGARADEENAVWIGVDAGVIGTSFSNEFSTVLGAHGRVRVAPIALVGGSIFNIDAETHYEKCKDEWCPERSTALTADVEVHPLSFLPVIDPWAGARAGFTLSEGNWASEGEDRSGVQPIGELSLGLDLAASYFALGPRFATD